MKNTSFEEAVAAIIRRDARYSRDAYFFLREALSYTAHRLDKPVTGTQRHMTAADLMEGVRDYALEEYGPMAHTVLNHWGIYSTEDFGAIVFNLVDEGALGKSEDDCIEDFENGYDFDESFLKPFRCKGGRRACASSCHSE